ncbi:MAG: futalosine hydrolase [Desulfovibrionaceae bacterium]
MLLVLAATRIELRAALGGLGAPVPAQGRTADWEVGGRALRLGVCGMGVVNAALFLGAALGGGADAEGAGDSGISGVLGLGVCGSGSLEALPLRTPCLTRWSVWPEYGLRGDGETGGSGDDPEAEPDARTLGLPLASLPGGRVWDRVDHPPLDAARAMGLTLPERWPWVTSCTVSAVGGPERARRTARRFEAQTENMEGFAWAYGCALAGLPFLELRTVSNLAGTRPGERIKGHEVWDLPGALEALGAAAARLLAPTPQTPCEARGNPEL